MAVIGQWFWKYLGTAWFYTGRMLLLPVMQQIFIQRPLWARLCSNPFSHGAHILIYQTFFIIGSSLWNLPCKMSLSTEQSNPGGLSMLTDLENQSYERNWDTRWSQQLVLTIVMSYSLQSLFHFQESEIEMIEFRPCCKVKYLISSPR